MIRDFSDIRFRLGLLALNLSKAFPPVHVIVSRPLSGGVESCPVPGSL